MFKTLHQTHHHSFANPSPTLHRCFGDCSRMSFHVLDLLTDLFGIHPRKVSRANGGKYHGPCPGCGGKDRFIVWSDQNDGMGGYWCNQCSQKDGKPKDNVQFLVEFKGMEYPEAFAYVGRGGDYRRAVKPLKSPRVHKADWTPTEHDSPVELWQAKAKEFVDRACEALLGYKAVMKWLESRGIGADTVRKYKLGYNFGNDGHDLYRNRKGWGLPEEFKEDGKPKSLWLPVGLVIPYLIDGQVCRIRIRRTKEALQEKGGPKYYIVKGSKSNTMLLEPDREAFVVVESELDAMAIAGAAGDMVGAVAVGSLSAKPDAGATERLRSSLSILNALDYEIGGKSGENYKRSLSWWRDNFKNCKFWLVPEGKDPGEAVAMGIDLREWVIAGLPPVMTIKRPSSHAVPSKSELIKSQVAPELSELKKLLLQSGVFIRNTSDELGIIEPYLLWTQKHWEVFSRISDLVFRTDSVWEYVRNHPASIITGENLICDEILPF